MKQTQPNTTANKHGMLYDLEDKVPAGQSVIYGVQYLVYFLAGSAIMPVIIGAYLGLDQAEIAQMLQRTFLLSGGVSILQAILGHRYPIIDGPAGLMDGLLIILARDLYLFRSGSCRFTNQYGSGYDHCRYYGYYCCPDRTGR